MKKALIIVLSSILTIFLYSCSESTPQDPNNVTTADYSVSEEESLKEIYSDDLITISFIKKYDTPQLQGMFSFDIKAENKSNKEITIYLQDAYLNDSTVSIGSGIPLELLAGKNGTNIYSGKYEGTGITTADEIKKIRFKILVMDESSNTLETTENIKIDF